MNNMSSRTITYERLNIAYEFNITSLPFTEGKFYTCFNTDNRGSAKFEAGERYQCVKVTNKERYYRELDNDGSTVKFVSENGTVCSWFGHRAINHFTHKQNIMKRAIEVAFINNDVWVKIKKEDVEKAQKRMKAEVDSYEEIVNKGIEISELYKKLIK